MNELLTMIKNFIEGNYNALSFSHDAPDYLIKHYDEIEAVDAEKAAVLNDELPDICDVFERGDDPEKLRAKIRALYEKLVA